MQKSFSHYKLVPHTGEGHFESSFFQTWSSGGVYGVLSLESKEHDVEKVGNLLQETSLDLVMNSVEEDRIKLLKEVLNSAKDTYEKIFPEDIESSLGFGVLLLLENTIYVGILGDVQCFIHRAGRTLNLSSAIEKTESPVFSGQLQQSDLVLLTTQVGAFSMDSFEETVASASSVAGFVLGDELAIEKLVECFENVSEVQEESGLGSDETEVEKKEMEPELVSEDAKEIKETVQEKVGDSVVKDESAKIQDLPVLEEQVEKVVEEEKWAVVKDAFSNISKRISPIVQKFLTVIVEKPGKIVTWTYETVIGSGKKVGRYHMPGDNSMKRRRLVLLFFIIILAVGLYFSVSWIKTRNYIAEQQESYETLYSQIEVILTDAETKSVYSVDETNLLLKEARSKIEQLEQYEVESNDAQSLQQRALQIQDSVEGRIRLDNPDVVADIKISFENADPADIIFCNGSLLLTDPDARAVYKVDENNDVSQVLSSSDGLRRPMYLELIDDTVYIYDAEEGMLAYSPDAEEKVRKVTGLSASTLGNVTEISSFDGALYFLIADEGKIMKASPAGSGFSYPYMRLQDDSFRTAKDLEINGLIYTLGGGELVRFYVDTKDNQVSISGVSPAIGAANNFELLASLKVLILDGDNKRLVVLNQPEGNSSIFKLYKQYSVSEEEERYFNDLREVTVDPATNTVYILDGFRVIKVSLDE